VSAEDPRAAATDPVKNDPAATEPVETQAVFLVLTTSGLKDSVAGVIESARYRASIQPSLDGVRIVGPVRPARSVGQWLSGSDDTGEAVWRALRSSIPKLRTAPGANLLLGVVVVDRLPSAVADQIAALRGSPRLQALPLRIHGLSIGAKPADENGESKGAVADSATARDRLDGALLRIIQDALSDAEADPELLIPEQLLGRLFDGRTVQREAAAGVRAVTLSDDDESAGHARLLASRFPARPDEPQRNEPARPRADATPESKRPLRRVYIVVGSGIESRPRGLRRRLRQLIADLDLSLAPSDGETDGYTWLVAAGHPTFASPTVRPSGTLTGADLPRGSATRLDMRETMRGVAEMVRGHEASFLRRGQALTPPAVVFVLPSATLAGPTTQAAYRAITDHALVGWIVTGSDSRSPSRDVDRATLVYDKADAANALAAALRAAELEASNVDSILRDLENEMQQG